MLKQAKVGSSDNRINYSGELHYLISSTTWELCTRADDWPDGIFINNIMTLVLLLYFSGADNGEPENSIALINKQTVWTINVQFLKNRK